MKLKFKEVLSELKLAKRKPALKVIRGGKKQEATEVMLFEKEILACCQATD